LGNYAVVCAELCVLGHATMRQTAHVVTQSTFATWMRKQGSSKTQTGNAQGGAAPGNAQGGGGGTAADGKKLFTSNGCSGCHALADAGSAGGIGPNLDKGLAGKDPAFIKESIVKPNSDVTKGFQPGIMPPDYEQRLSPAEIDALVKYLQETTKG
jgi:cytochrome c oxidase subunit II